MLKTLPVLVFCWICASPITAQVPRPSTLINTNELDDSRGIGLASAGELTAVVWNEGGATNQVFVAVSDGRGLSWSAPLRVDADTSVKTTQQDSVFVSGDSVYVVWEADTAAFFSRSLDRGATFEPPVPLDIGPGSLRDWRVAVSPDAAGDHIYVLASTAVTDEDLFLTASHDGGSSFSAAILVPAVGSEGDVDALALAADGPNVHVAWDDNRSGRDAVYYQRSSDGGATFLAADVELGDDVGVEDSQDPVNVALLGSTVAVGWNEEPTGTGAETVVVNVSTDGGDTFQGAVTVGSYTVGVDDTDEGDISINATGNVIVTWEDDRTGVDEAYVSVSTDGGATFGPDLQLSSNGAQNLAILAGGGATSDLVFWESTTFPSTAESSFSRDGGLTWSASLRLSDNSGFVDFPTATRNALYGNYVHAWAALDLINLKLYGGGFRPQTLTPVGNFIPGEEVHFEVENYPSEDDGLPFGILLSGSDGELLLPLGDGRNTGLENDALLNASLGLIPGPLSGTIGPDGSGSTPSITLPAGFPADVRAIAISLDPGAPVPFVTLTDVVIP